MTSPIPVPDYGPRLVCVKVLSCYGCPALVLRSAAGPRGGEQIRAHCRHPTRAAHFDTPHGELFSQYWRRDRAPPGWCPAAPPPAPTSIAPTSPTPTSPTPTSPTADKDPAP